MNTPPPAVLVLEHNRHNQTLITELLANHGYQAISTTDLEALDELLDKVQSVRLALVDLSGFDQRIWQYCERFRARGVPVVVITPSAYDRQVRVEGVAHGALGVLVKPISPQQLLGLINRFLTG